MTESTLGNHREGAEEGSAGVPDAHGQAALLLVESLLHGLVARSVISLADAIEIVEIAAEAREEIAYDLEEPPETVEKSVSLLNLIRASFSLDLFEKRE